MLNLNVTPNATLEHMLASRDALRAGSDGWAQLTGYATAGTSQRPPSIPPGRATRTLRVNCGSDGAAGGLAPERPRVTQTALLRDSRAAGRCSGLVCGLGANLCAVGPAHARAGNTHYWNGGCCYGFDVFIRCLTFTGLQLHVQTARRHLSVQLISLRVF